MIFLYRKNCMSFDEYVYALERVWRANKQSRLGEHFRPQHISCPVPIGTPTLVFDISDANAFLASLRGFELHQVKIPRMHSTPRDIVYDTTRLRTLAESEYKFVARHPLFASFAAGYSWSSPRFFSDVGYSKTWSQKPTASG